MRKLTYTVVTGNGAVKAGITSFDEAYSLIKNTNGRMTTVMQDIETPYEYKGKRVRPVAKAPVEKR